MCKLFKTVSFVTEIAFSCRGQCEQSGPDRQDSNVVLRNMVQTGLSDSLSKQELM